MPTPGAHLRENGRITLMWCAFTGPPTTVRIHGHGEPLAAAMAHDPLAATAHDPAASGK
jgi:hypothetical protein